MAPKDAVLRYAHAAARHAKATVDLIKARLEEDAAARAEGRPADVGLSAAFQKAREAIQWHENDFGLCFGRFLVDCLWC